MPAKMKLPVGIAVMDDRGHLLAFVRIDDAKPSSLLFAITKVRTGTGEVNRGCGGPRNGNR